MAKTLASIIADVRQAIAQPDSSNSNFTDAQLTIWINDAYRKIVTELRTLPITTRDYSVTGATVTINSGTLTIDRVKLRNPDQKNPDGSYHYNELAQINLDQLMMIDPDYEDTAADMPKKFVRTGLFTATLYPQPKASVIALVNPLRTFGIEIPSDLVNLTDTPQLPQNLHDIITHWAAFRCFSELENQAKAQEQITIFNGALKANKGISQKFSRALDCWKWGDFLS